jgi:hypothetical protein
MHANAGAFQNGTKHRNYAHGHTARCGRYRSPTYRSWASMRQRTTNENCDAWLNYGGRGIQCCPEWGRFGNFIADMGERPEGKTLDRIDVDGDYESANCRWATPSEQARNQRPERIARKRDAKGRYK